MKIKQILAFLLVITITCIIFNFSLQPADISDAQSGLFVNIAKMILDTIPNITVDIDTLTTIIRKLAHFSEYGALGVSVYILCVSVKSYSHSKLLYFYGIIIPFIDECIQAFIPGRSCQISDMLLDMSGFMTGLLVSYLLHKLLSKTNRRN